MRAPSVPASHDDSTCLGSRMGTEGQRRRILRFGIGRGQTKNPQHVVTDKGDHSVLTLLARSTDKPKTHVELRHVVVGRMPEVDKQHSELIFILILRFLVLNQDRIRKHRAKWISKMLEGRDKHLPDSS